MKPALKDIYTCIFIVHMVAWLVTDMYHVGSNDGSSCTLPHHLYRSFHKQQPLHSHIRMPVSACIYVLQLLVLPGISQ